MTIPLKDVYLDGRLMGRAGTWSQAAHLLASCGHSALALAILTDGPVSFGESPTGFFVRSRKEGHHAA